MMIGIARTGILYPLCTKFKLYMTNVQRNTLNSAYSNLNKYDNMIFGLKQNKEKK